MASPVAKSYSAASGTLLACGRVNTAASAVTVDNLPDYKVFQRVGASKAVTITGTYTGSPSKLQWRVVDFTTSVAATQWATLVISPTGGTFSKSVVIPQGGWYKVQVRDATNNAITGAATTRFGVGIVVMMLGQSNMSGAMVGVFNYPLGGKKSVELVSTNSYRRIGNINDTFPENTRGAAYVSGGYTSHPDSVSGSSRGDGYIYFANQLAAAEGVPVCMVAATANGTSIIPWMLPSGTAWTNYTSKLAAAGGDSELAIWLQGESDANTMSYATRLLRLADLHTQIKNSVSRNNTNMKMGIVAIGTGPYGSSSQGEFGVMRVADLYFAKNTTGVFLAGCAHDTPTGADTVHISGEGHSRLFKRVGLETAYQYGHGTSLKGPYIISASRSGTTVTVNIGHSGGTSLTDGSGGSGTSLTGFEFLDGSTPIATTATAISGNTLIFTLATTPAGALTISYGLKDVPHGVYTSANSFIPASCVYDNVAHLYSTVGAPLQPCAAISVT